MKTQRNQLPLTRRVLVFALKFKTRRDLQAASDCILKPIVQFEAGGKPPNRWLGLGGPVSKIPVKRSTTEARPAR
ncbi:hypothetical protein [Aureliella helgolandensis]|nr:hypothetical protein [Aureliella helgolandensis]